MNIGTQADYARHAGISKQAVNKMVRLGKIPRRPDGKIDFAEADHARNVNADPARNMADPPSLTNDESGLMPLEQAASSGGLSFSRARTAREAYQAKMAQLEYERLSGQVLQKRDVEDGLVTAGRAIRLKMDAIPGMADEVVSLIARGGGAVEVRRLLRTKVRDLEQTIVDTLTEVGESHEND